MGKNKALAAVLNFFVWGLGYAYLGKRVFGLLLFIGYLLVHGVVFYYGIQWGFSAPGIYSLAGHVVLSIAFAYDAYTAK